MNLWSDLPCPTIFAHRGASAKAPENTLSAFQRALDEGANAIEFDVKLSADAEVVIIHDRTIDRTTNGKGRVDELPLAALRELDAGSWFGDTFRGEKIPTLEETFEAFGGRLYMNVELTNYATPNDSLVKEVTRLVNRHGMKEQVLLSSFLPSNLEQAEHLAPNVPRGLLVPALWHGRRAWKGGWQKDDYQAVHPFFLDVSPGRISKAHSQGLRVHVYTVNWGSAMHWLLHWGVDGIITDQPSKALRLVRNRS